MPDAATCSRCKREVACRSCGRCALHCLGKTACKLAAVSPRLVRGLADRVETARKRRS